VSLLRAPLGGTEVATLPSSDEIPRGLVDRAGHVNRCEGTGPGEDGHHNVSQTSTYLAASCGGMRGKCKHTKNTSGMYSLSEFSIPQQHPKTCSRQQHRPPSQLQSG